MDSSAPIFILSCERSGSTLLQYILDTHPNICCPGELSVGTLVRDLRVTISRTFGLEFRDNPEKRYKVEKQEAQRVLTELLRKFAKSQGKKIWCDKTPYNLKYLEHLQWAFPDARYICLHRNSLDVVHSCLELPEQVFLWWALPYVVKHQRNLAVAFLDSWVEKTGEMLAFESRHPTVCRIKYESLVADPVGTLGPVFKFLGLNWNPSLLDRVFTVPRNPVGGDYKIRSTSRIEKDRVGKGAPLESGLFLGTPSDLKERQKAFHLELGYP